MKPETSLDSLTGQDEDQDRISRGVRINSGLPNRQLLIESLLNASHRQSPMSSICSLLLFGTNTDWRAEPYSNHATGHPSRNGAMRDSMVGTEATPSSKTATSLHNVALRNVFISLQHINHFLTSGGNPSLPNTTLIYRDLLVYLRDAGDLLATSSEPTISVSLVDAPFVLFLSIHLLATCETGIFELDEEDVMESITHLFGGFLSSYCGRQELAYAFDELRLERAWLGCLFNDDITFVTELRSRAGVLSLVEEIQRASRDMDHYPSVILSRLDVGIALTSFLDGWRNCQVILQLQMTSIDQIRRHSDIITSTCLDLAQLCAYDCGREALCAAVIDTPFPIFLIALEKHSTSQSMCETAKYLSIQIFHTALQFRSFLSPAAEETLSQVFRHIEPSALSPALFCRRYNSISTSHIDVFLELVDHPHLLYTDVNFACQLYVALSSLSMACAAPSGCSQLISALSDLRLPYSATAITCSALEETVNALCILVHGDALPPGRLRYAKPPYPILPIDKSPNGTKILQQSDAKMFAFRSALCLGEILLDLYRFCYRASEDRFTENRGLDEGSIKSMVQACIKTIHISRSFEGLALSLAAKLERTSLRIISTMSSAKFPQDVTASVNTDVLELIVNEILCEGGWSPRSCDTAASILSFIMTEWKSDEIIVNNTLLGSIRESLRKCGPEYSEQLNMWNGSLQQSRWLLAGGRTVTMRVWEEVLSRAEFWMSRGHSRYALKWFGVLHTLLARSTERQEAIIGLDSVFAQREPRGTFDDWIENMADLLPEVAIDCIAKLNSICALRRGLSDGMDVQGILEDSDIDDLIFANCTDYLEDINAIEPSTTQQRPASPSYWRGRISPEQGTNYADDFQRLSGPNISPAAGGLRNVGGGKIYIQNEFRSAHGASRNTSRAPSVHVDDFYSSN